MVSVAASVQTPVETPDDDDDEDDAALLLADEVLAVEDKDVPAVVPEASLPPHDTRAALVAAPPIMSSMRRRPMTAMSCDRLGDSGWS